MVVCKICSIFATNLDNCSYFRIKMLKKKIVESIILLSERMNCFGDKAECFWIQIEIKTPYCNHLRFEIF